MDCTDICIRNWYIDTVLLYCIPMWIYWINGSESYLPQVLLTVIKTLATLCLGIAHRNNKVTQRKIAEERAIPTLVQLLTAPPSHEVQVEVMTFFLHRGRYRRFVSQWASCQILKIAGCACAGNAPPLRVSDPDMHHGTCVTHVPWCMSGSLTSGFLWIRWWGKRSRHSRCMHIPQFYVSGKRTMTLQQLCMLHWTDLSRH